MEIQALVQSRCFKDQRPHLFKQGDIPIFGHMALPIENIAVATAARKSLAEHRRVYLKEV